jgi:hypothetical protein
MLFTKGEKVVKKGAYVSLKYLFLAIHAKGGPHHHQFSKFELRKDFKMIKFSIGILFLREFQIGSPSSKTNV